MAARQSALRCNAGSSSVCAGRGGKADVGRLWLLVVSVRCVGSARGQPSPRCVARQCALCCSSVCVVLLVSVRCVARQCALCCSAVCAVVREGLQPGEGCALVVGRVWKGRKRLGALSHLRRGEGWLLALPREDRAVPAGKTGRIHRCCREGALEVSIGAHSTGERMKHDDCTAKLEGVGVEVGVGVGGSLTSPSTCPRRSCRRSSGCVGCTAWRAKGFDKGWRVGGLEGGGTTGTCEQNGRRSHEAAELE
jgi:hypothetical protein